MVVKADRFRASGRIRDLFPESVPMAENNLNPYAPSQVEVTVEKAKTLPPNPQNRVSTLSVALWTISVCVAAGSLFGVATIVFLATSAALFGGAGASGVSSLGPLALFSLYAFVAGAVLALVASVPTVGIAMTIIVLSQPGFHWSRKRIQRFAMVCGAISGFLPLSVTSMFDPGPTTFSLIPAAFGAIAARLMIIPLARRAKSAEPLWSEPDGN